jgi:hypothetical protein
VAMLQAEGQVFYRPKDKQAQADAKKVRTNARDDGHLGDAHIL